MLNGGASSGGLTTPLSIENNQGKAENKVILTFTPTTGLFTGKLATTNSPTPIPLTGVVLQKRNIGLGYFLEIGATASDPASPPLPVLPVITRVTPRSNETQSAGLGQSGEVRLESSRATKCWGGKTDLQAGECRGSPSAATPA